MVWRMHDDATFSEIAERLAVDGYGRGSSLVYAVMCAYAEGRLVWTAKRLTIVGQDACDLRPDDAPLCHSPRGRT